ncbi:hypothetical protein Lal_00036712 [Lupinus albus]|nr:hypothetical protein Lal_00036712 [Lupinus albus]
MDDLCKFTKILIVLRSSATSFSALEVDLHERGFEEDEDGKEDRLKKLLLYSVIAAGFATGFWGIILVCLLEIGGRCSRHDLCGSSDKSEKDKEMVGEKPCSRLIVSLESSLLFMNNSVWIGNP